MLQKFFYLYSSYNLEKKYDIVKYPVKFMVKKKKKTWQPLPEINCKKYSDNISSFKEYILCY